MRHYFISSFQPSQVLILHSYLLLAPVVCRSSGEKKKTKKKRKPPHSSRMQYTFTALSISFKIVFAVNRKNVGFNISYALQHLVWVAR